MAFNLSLVMKPLQIENIKNVVLAQFHRWFQVYERPLNEKRYLNQLDILSEDIIIESAAGKSKGKLELKKRLNAFEGWLNAHHVKKTQIEILENNLVALEADLLYQNIRPDQSRYSYSLHYSTILQIRKGELPVFTIVKITPTGNEDVKIFDDAYIENRARSFMYYWCYCIETSNGNSGLFRELLAEQFELHLSASNVAGDLQKFDEWIASNSSQIIYSAHYPKNFSAKENEDKTISVIVDFDWQGLSVNNEAMNGETHHEWVLENNMDERFAKMKRMEITQIKPFAVMKPLTKEGKLEEE